MYLSAHFPHLNSDFCLDFASGSSRFLAALASSASLPPPSSSASPPAPPRPFLSPAASLFFHSSVVFSAPPLSSFPPLAPGSSLSFRPSLSSTPSFAAAPHVLPPSVVRAPSASAPPLLSTLGSFSGGSGVPVSSSSMVSAPPIRQFLSAPAPSLFRPFALDSSSSVPVSSAPVASASAPPSDFVFPVPSSAAFAPSPGFSYGPVDDLPEDVAPDALPRDLDSAAPAVVPDSARSKFRRMLAFIVDLFPQAAGSPSAPPPPCAL